jgi:ATP-dependent helicase/nuclease subunit B
MKLFTELKVHEVSQSLQEKELTVKGGVDGVIRGLQRKHEGLSDEWQELYTWYKKHPEWSRKIEQLVEAAYYCREDRRLSKETATALYGEILKSSVTRLEKYSACAYAHFLSYGLRLKERDMYQFQAVDMGNLFHGAVERFSKKLEQGGYTWTNVPEDVRETFVLDSVDECIVDYGNSILYSSARNEYTILRLKRMLRRTVWALTKQLEKGDFVPVGYEVVFGGGKIDRIDVCEDEDKLYVKVIDYKTGEKAFDLGELCYGLQMQLVVYMNAALDIQKKKHPEKVVIPAGLLYYRMKDPIVDKPTQGKTAEDVILQELRPDGVVQGSEEVLEHLDRGFTGTSQVIPAARTQAGALSKTSKVLSEEDFRVISEYAKKQVQEVGEEILAGNVQLRPYALGGSTGCDYCPYHSVCGFDERMDGHEYRSLEKLGNDKALEKMREEVDTWE